MRCCRQHARHPRREQGLTLIEAALVLALAAVVAAGTLLYYQTANENNRLLNAQSEFGALQAVVQAVYTERNSYQDLDTSVTHGASGIPPNLRNVNGDPITPWGGAVIIGYTDVVPYSTYTIEYQSVPGGQCVPLVSEAVGASLTKIVVNGVDVMSPVSGNADVAKVTANCKVTDDNSVVWSLK